VQISLVRSLRRGGGGRGKWGGEASIKDVSMASSVTAIFFHVAKQRPRWRTQWCHVSTRFVSHAYTSKKTITGNGWQMFTTIGFTLMISFRGASQKQRVMRRITRRKYVYQDVFAFRLELNYIVF
jgi:hypothetical protein